MRINSLTGWLSGSPSISAGAIPSHTLIKIVQYRLSNRLDLCICSRSTQYEQRDSICAALPQSNNSDRLSTICIYFIETELGVVFFNLPFFGAIAQTLLQVRWLCLLLLASSFYNNLHYLNQLRMAHLSSSRWVPGAMRLLQCPKSLSINLLMLLMQLHLMLNFWQGLFSHYHVMTSIGHYSFY